MNTIHIKDQHGNYISLNPNHIVGFDYVLFDNTYMDGGEMKVEQMYRVAIELTSGRLLQTEYIEHADKLTESTSLLCRTADALATQATDASGRASAAHTIAAHGEMERRMSKVAIPQLVPGPPGRG